MGHGYTTSEAERTTDFRCVQCGHPIRTLYIQYSPGNIRLMKCGNCEAVADEYIECEVMILLIDLILHKPKAYRHLFYNMFSKETLNFEGLLWKSFLGFLILDAYQMWVLNTGDKECEALMSVAVLQWNIVKILAAVILGNFMFFSMIFLGIRKLLNASPGIYRYKDILLAILVSSYIKIFLVSLTVWEFPSSVNFIIDMFVVSSNTVALKVITDAAAVRCLAVCTMSHAIKYLAGQGLGVHPLKLDI